MLLGLLRKDPSDRLTWEEISRHHFWKDGFELRALPLQQRWEALQKRRKVKQSVGTAMQVCFIAYLPVDLEKLYHWTEVDHEAYMAYICNHQCAEKEVFIHGLAG